MTHRLCVYGAWFAVACVVSACKRAAPIAESKGNLGGDIVARVGETPIVSALVGRVAGAQSIDPRAALDRLVDDALAANGALDMHLDMRPYVAWSLVSTRARFVADHARDDARAAGPPTDAEVAEVTELHWKDVDRPEAVRVTHAIVVKPKGKTLTPAEIASAKAIAAALEHAVAGATSADDFETRAKAVAHPGFDVVVQRLPAFVADGRVSEPDDPSAMDPTFARAAFTLAPNATSGIVESPFGWHVIRLIERIPPKQLSFDARRTAFTDEILTRRAHATIDARLAAASGGAKMQIAPDADTLMSSVSVARPE